MISPLPWASCGPAAGSRLPQLCSSLISEFCWSWWLCSIHKPSHEPAEAGRLAPALWPHISWQAYMVHRRDTPWALGSGGQGSLYFWTPSVWNNWKESSGQATTPRIQHRHPQTFCDKGFFICPGNQPEGQLQIYNTLRSCKDFSATVGWGYHLYVLFWPCYSSLVLLRKDIIHSSGTLVFFNCIQGYIFKSPDLRLARVMKAVPQECIYLHLKAPTCGSGFQLA